MNTSARLPYRETSSLVKVVKVFYVALAYFCRYAFKHSKDERRTGEHVEKSLQAGQPEARRLPSNRSIM